MVVIPYLEWKNKMFREILKEILKNRDFQSITYLISDEIQWQLPYDEYFNSENERYYFDLLMVEFTDEEENIRQMFLPVPLLNTKTIKKIQRLIEGGVIKVAHRHWHDRYKQSFPEITNFYPPSFEEECFSSEEED